MTEEKKQAMTGSGDKRTEFSESGGFEKKGAQVVNYDATDNFKLPDTPPPGFEGGDD